MTHQEGVRPNARRCTTVGVRPDALFFIPRGSMVRIAASLALTLVVLASSLLAQSLNVGNPGFESASGSLSADWTVKTPVLRENHAGPDRTVAHGGAASMKVEHVHPGTFAAASTPAKLEIGKLYRVSGWIRTENATADPTSRYPTAVAATLTMESFPFTNNATVVGGTHEWMKSESMFIATQSEDRVVIRFGYNGTASGTAWFDDVAVEEVDDISSFIPMETVRWFGPAFRYTDRGWTFVHIEGTPYDRGYQYGSLLSKEIVAYMDKLAIRANGDNPAAGWGTMRTMADALMLRRYDPEYLEEMKGIAGGAAKAGGNFRGRAVDFLDIVTVNSAVDLGQLGEGLSKSPTALSGRSFRAEEDELNAAERLHKCSSFLANGPASRDGGIVFGQLFMWNGYTGVHWDVICDVVPARGHRLVYETFPGGIHSGADFYINDAGIMIGETTVMQTPFNPDGEPQSSRIRKAAQYAESIDDVAKILTTNNNGLYTNDWLIGDAKANETAILLLGTERHKLWRSSRNDFPGGTTGFYWSNNNAKDPEVRKEYVPDPSNAPFDLAFSPWNRDLAFVEFYRQSKGTIDATRAVNFLASSPITRPHACDGKVTTSAMAKKMVFMANYGKVTMREKIPEKNSRLMPDLPGVLPHLSLGYSVFSPVMVTEKLKALKAKEEHVETATKDPEDLASLKDLYSFDRRSLWLNTVYPATEAENWFVSGTAAYWQMLNALPADTAAAAVSMRDQFAEMNCRLVYTVTREGALAPRDAVRRYDRYGAYVIPRIRGTYLLHQLRLLLGNVKFAAMMTALHAKFREKPMTTAQFVAAVEDAGGKEIRPFVMQWLERDDLPDPHVTAVVQPASAGSRVTLQVRQQGIPYQFLASVAIQTPGEKIWKNVKVMKGEESFTFDVKELPRLVVFNAGNDIPVPRRNYYTLSNYFDDFTSSLIVYGTGRHIEANHTAALKFQTVLADQFVELMTPLRQDAEITEAELAANDLIVLGGVSDNALTARLAQSLGIAAGKNMFRWQGKVYGEADEGLFVAMPNPFNPARAVYLYIGNSALEVYQMTKRFQGLPSWGLWKGDQVVEKGYLPVEPLVVSLGAEH